MTESLSNISEPRTIFPYSETGNRTNCASTELIKQVSVLHRGLLRKQSQLHPEQRMQYFFSFICWKDL